MTVIINFKLHTSNFTLQTSQLMQIIKILTIRIYFPMMGISLVTASDVLLFPNPQYLLKLNTFL